MSIKYEPSKLIKRLRKKAAAVVNENLSVNRAAVKALTEFGFLPKKVLETVALKVIKQSKALGRSAADTKNILVPRIWGATLHEQTRVIQRAYRGEFYKWLPSVAKEPRPEHEKNYGKIFQVGVGDKDGNDPGDLPFCQCGMELLVDDTTEEFNERLEDAL